MCAKIEKVCGNVCEIERVSVGMCAKWRGCVQNIENVGMFAKLRECVGMCAK